MTGFLRERRKAGSRVGCGSADWAARSSHSFLIHEINHPYLSLSKTGTATHLWLKQYKNKYAPWISFERGDRKCAAFSSTLWPRYVVHGCGSHWVRISLSLSLFSGFIFSCHILSLRRADDLSISLLWLQHRREEWCCSFQTN